VADGGVKVIDQAEGDDWKIWNGDCVDVARGLPDGSLHYTVFSPPFESLYTFSDDPRDMSQLHRQRDVLGALPVPDRRTVPRHHAGAALLDPLHAATNVQAARRFHRAA
jgi:hypothetical protein